ncbi:MAG TPA: PAS domain-containing protein [Candidatus Limnocylindria bacterium]|nr:PAS domain-containing protein [Candidatus Limnocylindria bacterium]
MIPLRGTRAQLLVALAVVGGGLLAAHLFAEKSRLRNSVETEARARAHSQAGRYTYLLSRFYHRGDPIGGEAAVTGLATIPQVRAAVVVDDQLRVIAATDLALRGLPLRRTPLVHLLPALEPARRGRGPLVTPLLANDRFAVLAPLDLAAAPAPAASRRGLLIVEHDLSAPLAAAWRAVLAENARGGVAGLIAIALLWLFLEVRLVRRARRLSAAAARFTSGDRDARSGVAGTDELGQVGLAFDRMAEESQHAEDELRQARALLEGMLESLPVGVIVVRREDCRPLYVNPKWRSFYGGGLDVHKDIYAILRGVTCERSSGEPYPLDQLSIPTVLRTGAPARVDDLVLRRANGESIPMVVTAVPVSLAGKPDFDAVISVAQDRRELERAFRELRAWERRFETVVEATGQVVYEWDVATNEGVWSGSLHSVLGYRTEDFRGGFTHWESLLHPDDRGRALDELEACRRERRRYDVEYRIRHAQGHWLIVRDRGSFHYDGEGAAVRRLGTIADETVRRSLEASLRHAHKMETVGTMAGGIAHDFNNQLTGVLGHLELLEQDLGAADPRGDHLRLARQAAERCAELTRAMLAFGRKLIGEPKPLVVNLLIDELCASFERVMPESISVVLRLDPEAWTVRADASQIHQVLLNLCLNARDAMPEGGTLTVWTGNVTLRDADLARHPDARTGPFVEVGIQDTGAGITVEALPHVFEPFFTTKTLGSGSGLGLAVAYGIVTSHGGWIEAESTAGEGATFRFYLPRVEARVTGAPMAPPHATGARELVLVVDDEAVVRDLAERTLRGEGYRVLTASDGSEALSIYQRHLGEIATVVLDLAMPGKPGRQVLDELLALDPGARVILSSGYHREIAGVTASGRAAAFLAKPYGSLRLLSVVRNTLDAGTPSVDNRAPRPGPFSRTV